MRVSETADTALAALFRTAAPPGEAGKGAGAAFELAFQGPGGALPTPATPPIAFSAISAEGQSPRWVAELLVLVAPDVDPVEPTVPNALTASAQHTEDEVSQSDAGQIENGASEIDVPPAVAPGLSVPSVATPFAPLSGPALTASSPVRTMPVDGAAIQQNPVITPNAPRPDGDSPGTAPAPAGPSMQSVHPAPAPTLPTVPEQALTPKAATAGSVAPGLPSPVGAPVLTPPQEQLTKAAPRTTDPVADPVAARPRDARLPIPAVTPRPEAGIPTTPTAGPTAETNLGPPVREVAKLAVPPAAPETGQAAKLAIRGFPPEVAPPGVTPAALTRDPSAPITALSAPEATGQPTPVGHLAGLVLAPPAAPLAPPLASPGVRADTSATQPAALPDTIPDSTAQGVASGPGHAPAATIRTEPMPTVAPPMPAPAVGPVPQEFRRPTEAEIQRPATIRWAGDTTRPDADATAMTGAAATGREPAETQTSSPLAAAEGALAPGADSRGPDTHRAVDPGYRPTDPGPRAAQQVAVALAMNPEGRIELTLDPEELGPVRLGLVPGDGSVTVHLAAERAETLDLLRRHTDILARELRQAGYGDVSFRFGSETPAGGHQPPRHGYDTPPANATTPDTPAPEAPAPVFASRRAIGPGTLDLRL